MWRVFRKFRKLFRLSPILGSGVNNLTARGRELQGALPAHRREGAVEAVLFHPYQIFSAEAVAVSICSRRYSDPE